MFDPLLPKEFCAEAFWPSPSSRAAARRSKAFVGADARVPRGSVRCGRGGGLRYLVEVCCRETRLLRGERERGEREERREKREERREERGERREERERERPLDSCCFGGLWWPFGGFERQFGLLKGGFPEGQISMPGPTASLGNRANP